MHTILDKKVINTVEIRREINAETKHHGKCNSTQVFFSYLYIYIFKFYIVIGFSKKK